MVVLVPRLVVGGDVSTVIEGSGAVVTVVSGADVGGGVVAGTEVVVGRWVVARRVVDVVGGTVGGTVGFGMLTSGSPETPLGPFSGV